jgi:tetratricopeptide (TPR) repeat protein
VNLRRPATRMATFYDHLKLALELFGQPAQLGERSLLASPYLLGSALRGVEPTPFGRGQAFCALIVRAAESLWGGPLPVDGRELLDTALAEAPASGRYDCLVLELNYFKQRYRPVPRNQAEIYSDILHISRPTHDRHLRSAIERLGVALLDVVRPAIHLEQPMPPPLLIGRESLLITIRNDLLARKCVALSGPGGVGKSALAVAASEGGPGARFWYTFRPGLNDRLESVLFALGHFLHGLGASALWQQLLAGGGRVPDGSLALGLALADLQALPAPPLLCFDELDVLRSLSEGEASVGDLGILAFIEGLQGHAPLLLIGQRPAWVSDTIHTVPELTSAQLAAWLDALGIPYLPADVARLHSYTAGNPRFAELCVALFHSGVGDSFAATLDELPRAQALLPLWVRLARSLPTTERRLLHMLAVFRSPAPADVWLNADGPEVPALRQLIARRLVQPDDHGGVALLPALRDVIYGELTAERREELHAHAAQIRAERGAYTAAAYHLFRAGQPEAAIDLWYGQREQEINQGQAGAALAIFAQISPRQLSPRHGRLLLLLRAELHELAGAPVRTIADLAERDWPADERTTPEAMLRLGRAIEAQGDRERARSVYQAGLDATAALLHQSTQLHVQRSLTSLRQREMQQAWREARLAYFHAVTMLGIVSDQSGDYRVAREHYLQALTIAEQAGYQAGLAQTHHYLAMLAGRRHDLDEALPHFEQAIAFYERVGDRLNREYVRGNLASVYIQARRFAAALEPAEQALSFFAAMGNAFRIAQNASNLAEAHAELGNLEQAEHYARLVLGQEEPQSKPYALYTLGTVHRQRGDLTQAERSYYQCRRIAEANDDSYLLAFAWRALGEVLQARGEHEQAQTAFTQAVALFRRLNLEEEVRHTLALAGQDDANFPADDA